MTQKIGTKKAKVCFILVSLLFAALAAQLIVEVNVAYAASSDNYILDLKIQNGTGQVYSPFDEIKLIGNVTADNVGQSGILVTYKIQGPTISGSSITVTRVITTDSNGIATFSFRLPIDNQNKNSLTGVWHATAKIQTANGTTITQEVTFTTEWKMEINSVNLQNTQGVSQTSFNLTQTVKVKLEINNKAQPQLVNVTVSMKDSSNKLVNQTIIQNRQLQANLTQLEANIQVPKNATKGEGTIEVAVLSGNFLDINLPVAQSKSATFTVLEGLEPTITPTPTPTSTAPPNENTISLFSWLLVATGIFTFTGLFFFLKRKPTPKTDSKMPNLTPTISSPVLAAPTLAMTPALQPTASPVATVAPQNVMNATLVEPEIPVEQPINPVQEPPSKPSLILQDPLIAHLSKIAGSAKRIQELNSILREENELLNGEIKELNKSIQEQEQTIKNYFDTIRNEVKKLTDACRLDAPTQNNNANTTQQP
jgi:hypothetical protein